MRQRQLGSERPEGLGPGPWLPVLWRHVRPDRPRRKVPRHPGRRLGPRDHLPRHRQPLWRGRQRNRHRQLAAEPRPQAPHRHQGGLQRPTRPVASTTGPSICARTGRLAAAARGGPCHPVLCPPPRSPGPGRRPGRDHATPSGRRENPGLRPVRSRALHAGALPCRPSGHGRAERIFAVDPHARTGPDPALRAAWRRLRPLLPPGARGCSGRRWPTRRLRPGRIPQPHPALSSRRTGRTTSCQLQAFHAFARESRGLTPPRLRWPGFWTAGAHVLPIPGTRSADHLRAWARAPEIDLSDHDRDEIDRLLPIGWAWGDRYDDTQAATVERYDRARGFGHRGSARHGAHPTGGRGRA
jgi:hypothetical protein